MSFTYDRFGSTYAGGVVMPITLHPFSDSPGAVPSSMVDLPGGGAWDYLQGDIARPRYGTVTHKGKVMAATGPALQTAINALYALKGKRDLLWKSSDGGTTNQWRYARVLDVRADWGLRNATPYAIVEMDFELAAGPWSGAPHAETTAMATGDDVITTTNGGNVIVRDAIITILGSGPTITQLDFYKSYGDFYWRYSGSILDGEKLIINCGTKRVTNNDVDDFAHFILSPVYHTTSDWSPIAPGLNTLVVKRTGGSNLSICNLVYNDGWM